MKHKSSPSAPSPSVRFTGYSKDRFEAFRKHKEDLFHMKYGRFANKNASLSNSKESTMVEPGSFFAIDNLFEETNEKIAALRVLSNHR